MSDRILIWRAGAIGGTVGASLKRAGHDVTFVDVVQEHVAAIRDPARGLRITGPVQEVTVVAPAFLPVEIQVSWSQIFLCVKAHHTDQPTRALAPHLGRTTRRAVASWRVSRPAPEVPDINLSP